MAGHHYFHWADYLVFALILGFSAAVGVYYGIQDRRRKQNTLDHFLLAGRKMSILPVTFSIFVSWTSSLSFLAHPVDVYYNGAVYILLPVGYVVTIPVVAWLFAPKLNQMKIYSAYQFIETRYNTSFRVLVSVVNGLMGGIYCGMVLYGPAIALSQATGLGNWVSMVIVSLVCIFYTTLGGMKAVLWTDTLQIFVMFSGFVALLIRGLMVVGGLGEVWKIAEREGRVNILNFNPSPFVRSTFWTYLIGGCFTLLGSFTSEQTFIQRYFCVKDPRSAAIVVLLTIPLYIVFGFMFTLMGLVMLAYFDGCDPMMSGRIERKDQMIPLMVLELLGFVPGLPGLLLGSVFCASLSSFSSYLNSLSLTLLKDIVEPVYGKFSQKPMSSKMSLGLTKLFCIILGLIFLGIALVIDQTEDASMFELSKSILGLLSGPVCALFCMGLYVPLVKSLGATVGVVVSLAVCMWWYLGSWLVDLGPSSTLRLSVDNCTFSVSSHTNHTTMEYTTANYLEPMFMETTLNPQADFQSGVNMLYEWSPLLYNGLGFCVTFVVAILIGIVQKCFTRGREGVSQGVKGVKEEDQDVSSHMLKEY